MGRIKILSEELISKIAAGEVVERPASVVKELIENSIDAGANSIKIFIKEYGTALIKVVDDGEGIYSDDVILAFQRHATSKIQRQEDLFNIKTLGFRGEALYSIAGVCKLKIITQHREEEVGTEVYSIGGKLIERKPAITSGTTVEVRDLFFNTPVRKKFLKSPATEKSHIIETVQNYALCYPKIAFYLNIDDVEVLNLHPSSSIQERICQLYGIEFFKKLKFRDLTDERWRLELYWGVTELDRSKRTKQLIFINQRPVREPLLLSLLYQAFQVGDKHPQFILFLNVPAEAVDFNVHPSKKEARFRDPQHIRQLIFKLTDNQKLSTVEESPVVWKENFVSSGTLSQQSFFDSQNEIQGPEFFQFLKLGDALVALQRNDGILFIDYHAGHERVIFEKILNGMPENVTKLVFPQIINLTSQDYQLIKENLSLLHNLHIEAEDFGKNSIIVRGIPQILKDADLADIIEGIAVTLKEEIGKPDFKDIKQKIASTIACHKSLRANNKITLHEINTLLRELEKTSDPDHCPHGRPIKKFISLKEIKSWFSR